MLRRAIFMAFLVLVFSSPALAQRDRPVKGCVNAMAPLCLPEQVKSRKPFLGPDFVVNEIDLSPAGHVAIYQGIGLSEQEGVTGIAKERSYGAGDTGADVYVGSSPNGRYFDVHYRHAGMYGVVQIFGYIASAGDAANLGKFIANIQYCPHDADCALSQPLADAGSYIATVQ